jgi:hypothetical protein
MVGLSMAFYLRPQLNIETTLELVQGGFNITEMGSFYIDHQKAPYSYIGFDTKITHNYLNNSWLIDYHFGEKIYCSLQGGVFLAFLANSLYKSKDYYYVAPSDTALFTYTQYQVGYHEVNSNGKVSDTQFSNFDYGLTGGIRLGYHLNPKYQIDFSLRYFKGYSDIYRQYHYEESINNNRTLVISLGAKMKL